MIRQQYQAHTDVDDHTQGDCFRTCVAMILDMARDDVPNFCALGDDVWWAAFQHWLEDRHLTAVEVFVREDKPSLAWVTCGTPCILTGKSPRGDWLHSVVGIAHGPDGFEMCYDPYPDDRTPGEMLAGRLEVVTFFASLRPDLEKIHDPAAQADRAGRDGRRPEPVGAGREGAGGEPHPRPA
jgi:hypothetical protein